MPCSARPRRSIAARLLLMLLILGACIGCDRATKGFAVRHLSGAETISLFGGCLRIQYAENPGAFLGLGGALSPASRFWLLTIANLVFLAVIAGVLVVRWRMHRWRFVALSLLLAGGIGNLIDRIAYDGRVIDFLNVGLGPLRTGIFNVADVAITGGAVALFFLYPRGS